MEDLAKKFLEVEQEYCQKKEELSSLRRSLILEAMRRGEKAMMLNGLTVALIEYEKNDWRGAAVSNNLDMSLHRLKQETWKIWKTPQSPSILTSFDSEDT